MNHSQTLVETGLSSIAGSRRAAGRGPELTVSVDLCPGIKREPAIAKGADDVV